MRGICVFALLLAAPLSAQTFVVDSLGGGNFTGLQQAIDAVPDGATLHVRNGPYREFTIQAKSLTILGENVGSHEVIVQNPIRILGLRSQQRVHVSGLTFRTPERYDIGVVSLTNNAGGVLLHRINAPGLVTVIASQCQDLHLLGLTMLDPPMSVVINRIDLDSSNVQITDSLIQGNFGYFSGPGGPALFAQNSMVTLCASQLRGGPGGGPGRHRGPGNGRGRCGHRRWQFQHPCVWHGSVRSNHALQPGGRQGRRLFPRVPCRERRQRSVAAERFDGARVRSDAARRSHRLGWRQSRCWTRARGSTTGRMRSGRPRSSRARCALGNSSSSSLRGRPSAPAALLVSDTTSFRQPAPLALGALVVGPGAWLGGFSIPASGLLEIGVQVPLSWPGDTVVLSQFMIFDPILGEVHASNSFAAITR